MRKKYQSNPQRIRVSITVDKDVWAKCQLTQTQYNVVWSRVAEAAFISVMDSLEDFENSLPADPADQQQFLRNYVLRKFVD